MSNQQYTADNSITVFTVRDIVCCRDMFVKDFSHVPTMSEWWVSDVSLP